MVNSFLMYWSYRSLVLNHQLKLFLHFECKYITLPCYKPFQTTFQKILHLKVKMNFIHYSLKATNHARTVHVSYLFITFACQSSAACQMSAYLSASDQICMLFSTQMFGLPNQWVTSQNMYGLKETHGLCIRIAQ